MENEKVKNVLNQIIQAFESGNIPDAVAIASFPIPDIPSAKWSIRNRTTTADVWRIFFTSMKRCAGEISIVRRKKKRQR